MEEVTPKSNWRIAYFIAAIMNLSGELLEVTWLASSSKVLLMPLLMGHFLIANKNDNLKVVLPIAITFSWFGDIFLLFDELGELIFLLGMISFLFTHVLYIVGYMRTGINYSQFLGAKILSAIAMGVTTYFVLVVILPNTGGFKPYLIIYSVVIVSMAIGAFLRLESTGNKSFWYVLVGALLFVISDTLIAYLKFVDAFFLGGFLVMATYIVAQYLIVSGLAISPKR